MSDKLKEILDGYEELHRAAEQAEYDFFFGAAIETQEMFYQYWITHKDIDTAPRFLTDYVKSRPF